MVPVAFKSEITFLKDWVRSFASPAQKQPWPSGRHVPFRGRRGVYIHWPLASPLSRYPSSHLSLSLSISPWFCLTLSLYPHRCINPLRFFFYFATRLKKRAAPRLIKQRAEDTQASALHDTSWTFAFFLPCTVAVKMTIRKRNINATGSWPMSTDSNGAEHSVCVGTPSPRFFARLDTSLSRSARVVQNRKIGALGQQTASQWRMRWKEHEGLTWRWSSVGGPQQARNKWGNQMGDENMQWHVS